MSKESKRGVSGGQSVTYAWAVRLVGAVLALQDPVAVLIRPVAPAAEALEEALGLVAVLGPAVDDRVREDDEADVLEGAVGVDAVGRGREVDDGVGVASVEEPRVRVGAVRLLPEVRHLLDDVGVGELVAGLHRVERAIDTRQGHVSAWFAVDRHLCAYKNAPLRLRSAIFHSSQAASWLGFHGPRYLRLLRRPRSGYKPPPSPRRWFFHHLAFCEAQRLH
jgi:hypothetical protein